ncbi:hypothetical protein [Amycolatopsis pigmentata]|uniref:OTU domain-containing protein n=1 Tax=Amycolatopsis pigmentata TaxID=450801 RepID=A0ABW5G098_9PSEU
MPPRTEGGGPRPAPPHHVESEPPSGHRPPVRNDVAANGRPDSGRPGGDQRTDGSAAARLEPPRSVDGPDGRGPARQAPGGDRRHQTGKPADGPTPQDAAAALAAAHLAAGGPEGVGGPHHGNEVPGARDDAPSFVPLSEWHAIRDSVPVSRYHAERFDPAKNAESGGTRLQGRITQIRFDVRRGEVRPGQWVREIAAPIDLVSKDGNVDAGTRREWAETLQRALDKYFNVPANRFANGDQPYFRIDAATPNGADHGWDVDGNRNVPVEVVDPAKEGPGRADQVRWPIGDLNDALHELFHFYGLGEGYKDPELMLNRKDEPGIMGPDRDLFLAPSSLAKLDELSLQAGEGIRAYRPPRPADPPTVVNDGPYDAMHTPANAPPKPDDPPRPGGPSGPDRPPGPGGGPVPVAGPVDIPRLKADLSDGIALLERHLATLPPDFAPQLRERMPAMSSFAAGLPHLQVTPAELAGRLSSLHGLIGQVRTARLNAMTRVRDIALAKVERGENPLTFHPDGVPGGVSSRPDAKFGLEVELQLPANGFDHTLHDLGRKLEREGYIEWRNGAKFEDKEYAAPDGKWKMIKERAHEYGVELVSSIPRGGGPMWRNAGGLLDIIREHRSESGERPTADKVGGHVNISFDENLKPHEYARLAQLNKAFEATLYRLGNHHVTAPGHRKLNVVGPNPLPPDPRQIESHDDVSMLDTGKEDALYFGSVEGGKNDRLEFRWWASSLDPATWQAHAELTAAMVEAARNPAIHRRLDQLMADPDLLIRSNPDEHPDDQLAKLMDFLELLPLNPATQELVVQKFAATAPWRDDGHNDELLRAPMVVGPFGRGWLFPVPEDSVRNVVATAMAQPWFEGAEVLAATLTDKGDHVMMWDGREVPLDDFAEVLHKRSMLTNALHDDLDADPKGRAILAVSGGLDRLAPAVVDKLQAPVLATTDQVRLHNGRIELHSEHGRPEWVALAPGREPFHTGTADVEEALALAREESTDHADAPMSDDESFHESDDESMSGVEENPRDSDDEEMSDVDDGPYDAMHAPANAPLPDSHGTFDRNPAPAAEHDAASAGSAAHDGPSSIPLAEWQAMRDSLPVSRYHAERFDPAGSGRSQGGRLEGRITQIRFDVRRGEVRPGQVVREISVPLDLVSKKGTVDAAARREWAEEVQRALDQHFNVPANRFANGDQPYFRIDAATPDRGARGWDTDGSRNVPVDVVDPATQERGRADQVRWPIGDVRDALHEVFHFSGLGEGYKDSELLLNREDEGGIMGPKRDLFLTPSNVAKLDEMTLRAGDSIRAYQPPPRSDRATPADGSPYDAMHTPANAPPRRNNPPRPDEPSGGDRDRAPGTVLDWIAYEPPERPQGHPAPVHDGPHGARRPPAVTDWIAYEPEGGSVPVHDDTAGPPPVDHSTAAGPEPGHLTDAAEPVVEKPVMKWVGKFHSGKYGETNGDVLHPDDEAALRAQARAAAPDILDRARRGIEMPDYRIIYHYNKLLPKLTAKRHEVAAKIFSDELGRALSELQGGRPSITVDSLRFAVTTDVRKVAQYSGLENKFALWSHSDPGLPSEHYRRLRSVKLEFDQHATKLPKAHEDRLRWMIQGEAWRAWRAGEPFVPPMRLAIEGWAKEKAEVHQGRVKALEAVADSAVASVLAGLRARGVRGLLSTEFFRPILLIPEPEAHYDFSRNSSLLVETNAEIPIASQVTVDYPGDSEKTEWKGRFEDGTDNFRTTAVEELRKRLRESVLPALLLRRTAGGEPFKLALVVHYTSQSLRRTMVNRGTPAAAERAVRTVIDEELTALTGKTADPVTLASLGLEIVPDYRITPGVTHVELKSIPGPPVPEEGRAAAEAAQRQAPVPGLDWLDDFDWDNFRIGDAPGEVNPGEVNRGAEPMSGVEPTARPEEEVPRPFDDLYDVTPPPPGTRAPAPIPPARAEAADEARARGRRRARPRDETASSRRKPPTSGRGRAGREPRTEEPARPMALADDGGPVVPEPSAAAIPAPAAPEKHWEGNFDGRTTRLVAADRDLLVAKAIEVAPELLRRGLEARESFDYWLTFYYPKGSGLNKTQMVLDRRDVIVRTFTGALDAELTRLQGGNPVVTTKSLGFGITTDMRAVARTEPIPHTFVLERHADPGLRMADYRQRTRDDKLRFAPHATRLPVADENRLRAMIENKAELAALSAPPGTRRQRMNPVSFRITGFHRETGKEHGERSNYLTDLVRSSIGSALKSLEARGVRGLPSVDELMPEVRIPPPEKHSNAGHPASLVADTAAAPSSHSRAEVPPVPEVTVDYPGTVTSEWSGRVREGGGAIFEPDLPPLRQRIRETLVPALLLRHGAGLPPFELMLTYGYSDTAGRTRHEARGGNRAVAWMIRDLINDEIASARGGDRSVTADSLGLKIADDSVGRRSGTATFELTSYPARTAPPAAQAHAGPADTVRVPAGILVGDRDSPVARAVRWLPQEDGMFGVVLTVHGPIDRAAVTQAMVDAGWQGEPIRLFACYSPEVAEFAGWLSSQLNTPVDRPEALLWLGMEGDGPAARVGRLALTGDGRPLVPERPGAMADQGLGWMRHWPDGSVTPSSYTLPVPGKAPARLDLREPVHLGPTTVKGKAPVRRTAVERPPGGLDRIDSFFDDPSPAPKAESSRAHEPVDPAVEQRRVDALREELAAEPTPEREPVPDEEERTADYIVKHLPSYVRENRFGGKGPVELVETTKQVSVTGMLRKIAPGVAGWKKLPDVGAGTTDLRRAPVQRLLDTSPLKFAGKGERLTVTTRKGKKYELLLKTEADWSRLEPLAAAENDAKTAKSKEKTKVSVKHTTQFDRTFATSFSNAGIPGPVAGFTPRVPVAPDRQHDTGLAGEYGRSFDVELGKAHIVEVPLKVTATLFDEHGRVVTSPHTDSHGRITETGQVRVKVPLELAVAEDPAPAVLSYARDGRVGQVKLADEAKLAAQGIHRLRPGDELPRGYGVEAVVVHDSPDGKDPFDQIAERLGKQYGDRYAKALAIGSHGREFLRNFLSPDNLTLRHHEMAVSKPDPPRHAGWIRSHPLYKGRNARGIEFFTRATQLEARLVPRWYQVGTTAERKITDTSRTHIEVTDDKKLSRRPGLDVFGGFGWDTGTATTVMVGGAFGASRGTSHGRSLSRVVARKDAVSGTEDSTRYQVVYELQVRPVGMRGEPVAGAVTAHLDTRKRDLGARADRGFVPDVYRSGEDRAAWGPAEMEHDGDLPGRVEDISPEDQAWAYETLVPLLRKIPPELRRWWSTSDFIRSFDDPKLAKGLTPKIADMLSREGELRQRLSGPEISALMKMIGSKDGLKIVLKRKGLLHNYRYQVTLKGTLSDLRDGDPVQAKDQARTVRLKETHTATTGRTGDWLTSLGLPQVRVFVGATRNLGLSFVTGPQLTKTGAKSSAVVHTSGNKVDIKRGEGLTAEGKLGDAAMRRFAGTMSVEMTVLASAKENRGARKFMFGRPGLHVPKLVDVTANIPPEQLTRKMPVRFTIPEALTRDTPPDPPERLAPFDPATARPAGPEPLEPAPHVFDDVEVVSIGGVDKLQHMVKTLLAKVSKQTPEKPEDPIFAFEPHKITEAITHHLSPEALANDPALFSRTKLVEGLDHDRRMDKVGASVELSFRPTVERLYTTDGEYQQIVTEQSATSGTKQAGGKGKGGRFQTVFVLSPSGQGNPVLGTDGPGGKTVTGGFASIVVNLSTFGMTSNRTAETGLESTERFTAGGLPEPRILTHLAVKVEAAAQVEHTKWYKFGWDKAKPARLRGEITVPMKVWLTREQVYAALSHEDRETLRGDRDTWEMLFGHDLDHLLDEDGAFPVHPAREEHPERTLPVPASLREGDGGAAKPSLGLGGVRERIDLAHLVGDLRDQLKASLGKEAAHRLLPPHLVERGNDNHREARAFLSDVNRAMHHLLNGRRADPIRLENWANGETYDLTLSAKLTDAKFHGIEHGDKYKVANSSKTSETSTRQRGRVLANLTGTLRGLFRLHKVNHYGPDEPKPTEGQGPPMGAFGLGQSVQALFGTRNRQKEELHTEDGQNSGEISGPVAAYRGKFAITASITRHGTSYASATVTRDTTVTQSPDVSFPEPQRDHLGFAEGHRRIPRRELRRAGLDRWRAFRADGTPTPKLPDERSLFVEHYLGDLEELKKAARAALGDSGVDVVRDRRTGEPERLADSGMERALDAAVTSSLIKARRQVILEEGLRIPLPIKGNRILEFHARLHGSRFAALGGTKVDGSIGVKDKSTSEVQSGNTLEANRPDLPFVAGTLHPEGANSRGHRQPGQSNLVNTLTETRAVLAPSSAKLTAAGTRRDHSAKYPLSKENLDAKTDELSQLRLADIEWSVVAARADAPDTFLGGRRFLVRDALSLRMRNDIAEELTGDVLPSSLKDAAKDLHDKGKEWTAAELTRRGREHAARRARRALDLAEDKAAAEQEKIDKVIDRLPERIEKADQRADKARKVVHKVERALARAEHKGSAGVSVLEADRDAALRRSVEADIEARELREELAAALDRPLSEPDARLRDAFADAVDERLQADEDLREAEEAWWQAKRRYDAAVARKYSWDATHESRRDPEDEDPVAAVSAKITETSAKAGKLASAVETQNRLLERATAKVADVRGDDLRATLAEAGLRQRTAERAATLAQHEAVEIELQDLSAKLAALRNEVPSDSRKGEQSGDHRPPRPKGRRRVRFADEEPSPATAPRDPGEHAAPHDTGGPGDHASPHDTGSDAREGLPARYEPVRGVNKANYDSGRLEYRTNCLSAVIQTFLTIMTGRTHQAAPHLDRDRLRHASELEDYFQRNFGVPGRPARFQRVDSLDELERRMLGEGRDSNAHAVVLTVKGQGKFGHPFNAHLNPDDGKVHYIDGQKFSGRPEVSGQLWVMLTAPAVDRPRHAEPAPVVPSAVTGIRIAGEQPGGAHLSPPPPVWSPEAGQASRSATPGSPRLSPKLPESEWWRLFLDPRHHAEAQRKLPDDPGALYDTQRSPGFRQGLVDAYREFLDAPDLGTRRLTSADYKRMHELVTGHIGKKLDWSGAVTGSAISSTAHPLQADRPHPEVLAEKVGGRPLMVEDHVYVAMDAEARAALAPLTVLTRYEGKSGQPVLRTAYTKAEAPSLADSILDTYYDDLEHAGTEHERLRALGRAVRNLLITHLFEDGNRRAGVHVMLQRLLLEQGFEPAIVPARLFKGGYSADEIAVALRRAQDTGLVAPSREADDGDHGLAEMFAALNEVKRARREFDEAVFSQLTGSRSDVHPETAMARLVGAITKLDTFDREAASAEEIALHDAMQARYDAWDRGVSEAELVRHDAAVARAAFAAGKLEELPPDIEENAPDPAPESSGGPRDESPRTTVERARAQRPKLVGGRGWANIRAAVVKGTGGADSPWHKLIELAFSDENLEKNFSRATDDRFITNLAERAHQGGPEIRVTLVKLSSDGPATDTKADLGAETSRPGAGISSSTENAPELTEPAWVRIPTPHVIVRGTLVGMINRLGSAINAARSQTHTTRVTEPGVAASESEHRATYKITITPKRKWPWSKPVHQVFYADNHVTLAWPEEHPGEPEPVDPRAIEHGEFSGLGRVYHDVSESLGGFAHNDPEARRFRDDWLPSLADRAAGLFGGEVAKETFSFHGGKKTIFIGLRGRDDDGSRPSARPIREGEGTAEHGEETAVTTMSSVSQTRRRGAGAMIQAGDITGVTGAAAGPMGIDYRATNRTDSATTAASHQTRQTYTGPLTAHRSDISFVVGVGEADRDPARRFTVDGTATLWTRGKSPGPREIERRYHLGEDAQRRLRTVADDENVVIDVTRAGTANGHHVFDVRHPDGRPLADADYDRIAALLPNDGDGKSPSGDRPTEAGATSPTVVRFAPRRAPELAAADWLPPVREQAADFGEQFWSDFARRFDALRAEAGEPARVSTKDMERGTPPEHDPAGAGRHEVPDRVDARYELPDEVANDITGRLLHRLNAEGVIAARRGPVKRMLFIGRKAKIRTSELPGLARRISGFLKDNARELANGGDGIRVPVSSWHHGAPDIFVRGIMDRSHAAYQGPREGERTGGTVTGSHESGVGHGKTHHVSAGVVVSGYDVRAEDAKFAGSQFTYKHGSGRDEAITREFTHEQRLDSERETHGYRYPAAFEVRTDGRWSEPARLRYWRGEAEADGRSHTAESTVRGHVDVSAPAHAGRDGDVLGEVPADDWHAPGEPETRMRPGDLPPGYELAGMKPVPKLASTAAALLEMPRSARWKEWLKWPFVGGRPKALDEHDDTRFVGTHDLTRTTGGEHDAALDALEAFAHPARRMAAFQRTALYEDKVRLETHNIGGLAGHRELTGELGLRLRLGNPHIVGRDDEHVFTRKTGMKTTAAKGKWRSRGLRAKINVADFVPLRKYFLGGTFAEIIPRYIRAKNEESSDGIRDTGEESHVERGYLVSYGGRYDLGASARRRWQDFYGFRHNGTRYEKSRWTQVRDAVQVWVPASEIHRVGVLTADDLAKLDDAETTRYQSERQRPGEASLARQGIDGHPVGSHREREAPVPEPDEPRVRPPANVGRGVGRLDWYRLNAPVELAKEIGDALAAWSRDQAAKAGMKGKDYRTPSIEKFDQINERLLEVLGPELASAGSDPALAAMLNGGWPVVVTGQTVFGKVEQLVVLRAEPGEGSYHQRIGGRTTAQETEATRTDGDQITNTWTADIDVGVGYYSAHGPKGPGSLGLLVGGVEVHVSDSTGSSRHRSEGTRASSGKHDAVQFLHDLDVTMDVYPYSRPGTYGKFLERAWPSLAPRRFGEPWQAKFTLPGAGRSTVAVDESVTDGGAPVKPIAHAVGTWHADQAERGVPFGFSKDDKGRTKADIHVRPFAAPKLHAALEKLVRGDHDDATAPRRPVLRPQTAHKLFVEGGSGTLRGRLLEVFTRSGHKIGFEVNEGLGDRLGHVIVGANLANRKLLKVIDEGELSRTGREREDATTGSAINVAPYWATVADARGGLIEQPIYRTAMQGIEAIHLPADFTYAREHGAATEGDAGHPAGERPKGPRYLVEVTPRWRITPFYNGKKVPANWHDTIHTGRDEPILLEVDRLGLEELGLKAPDTAPEVRVSPPGEIRDPSARPSDQDGQLGRGLGLMLTARDFTARDAEEDYRDEFYPLLPEVNQPRVLSTVDT